MKKWILIIAGLIVVIVVVAVVLLVSNLGPIIKTAVNTYGPEITKTDVKLDDAGVSLLSGQAKLKGFYLGNPQGFKSKEAMKVGSVFVDIDEKSLTGDTIVIDKIEVVRPEITYEKAQGTDNFRTIMNNVQKVAGGGQASEKKQGGKKVLIKDFIVRDGKVTLVVPLLAGKTVSAPLPDIHLKDIGKEKQGVSPAEAAKQILDDLYKKIQSPAVTDSLNQGLESLGTSLDKVGESAKQVKESAEKEVEKVTDKVKGIFNR